VSLKILFEDGVEAFAASRLQRATLADDHNTFIHIPKTAGSSFREDIADVKQPAWNIEVPYEDLDPQKLPAQYIDMIAARLADYCANYAQKIRFVSGHFTYRDLAPFETIRESNLISMLREPLARLRSDFIYQTSPEHPLCESARERYPNFRSFIEDPDNQNVMFGYLCRDQNESIEATVDFICERYFWIGIQEDYRFSIKMLFMLFGMRIEPQRYLRVSTVSCSSKLELGKEDIRSFHARNTKDYDLYTFFRSGYQARLKEFYQNIDYDRFFRLFHKLPT
jgi:hypothetical protein